MATRKAYFFVLVGLLLAMTTALPLGAAPPRQEGDEGERAPGFYVVESGDTLGAIAARFDLDLKTLTTVNELDPSESLQIGQRLVIPGSDGSLPDPEAEPQAAAPTAGGDAAAGLAPIDIFSPNSRGTVTQRMTRNARRVSPNSPLYKTTWVAYYGRPKVDLMGILGEFPVEELIPILRAQADAYDEANGPDMTVTPAFELVYGMALCCENEDGSFLGFMSDEAVLEYIEAAEREGFQVILDIQVGKLTPLEAMSLAFKWLEYPNVHLALDPEFAAREPGQERPGRPPGWVTAEEINQIQHAMRDYMREHDLPGRRILLVHQFLLSMIKDKDQIEKVYKVDVVITADGFGNVWQKVGKYNSFAYDDIEFTGFKLFYRWDDPVMTEREVLGIDLHPERAYMDFTPNLIIYQ